MSSILNDFRELGVPFSLTLASGVGWKDNDARNTFAYCNNYNAPFTIPSDVMNCYGMFNNCSSLNSPIHIDPYGAVNVMDSMFYNCGQYQYDINIPVGCNSWYSLVNGYRDDNYNYQEYNGNIHVYTNNYQYGQGNFAWAFYSMYGFNGNVIFHGVSPTSMFHAFEYDSHLNQNILLPDSVQNLMQSFGYCYDFNQNIKIPSSATDCSYMFTSCANMNQGILFPAGVNASWAFSYCYNFNKSMILPSGGNLSSLFYCCNSLNQSFSIPYYATDYDPQFVYGNIENTYYGEESAVNSSNGAYIFSQCENLNRPVVLNDSIESVSGIFTGCYNFNQNVIMPSHLKFAEATFSSCYRAFNQNIVFPEGVLEMSSTFVGCSVLNQNIKIPSTVKVLSGCFSGCTNLDQSIQLPSGCTTTMRMFDQCYNLNSAISIPSSVINVYAMFRRCFNYNIPTALPEGIIDCSSVFEDCYNYYVSEGVIPSTVAGYGYGGAFFNTKVINVNVLTTNNYSSGVISLANAIDTSGMPISPVTSSTELPLTHADWLTFDFGTPVGYYKLPNASIYDVDDYWTRNRGLQLLGGKQYPSYASYASAKQTYEDMGLVDIWEQYYNHGGLHHHVIQDEYIWHEAVYYKDYPNATCEEDTDWYFYEVIHY